MSCEVLVICSYAHLAALLDQLRAYCEQTEQWQLAEVSGFDLSHKLTQVRIVVSFPHHRVDPALIRELDAESRVIDYYVVLDEPQELDALPLSLVPRVPRGSSWH